MNIIDLKNKLISANRAYRLGRPIMSDQEFDELVEEYQSAVSEDEYNEFRNTLHEDTGKVKHPYIMGSLDKLKSDEPQTVCKWLTDYVGLGNPISISAKVDGISCRLHYDAIGNFVSATTRGDGSAGIDCTDKAQHILRGIPGNIKHVFGTPKNLPSELDGELDIRGELVITDDAFASIADKFANPRNACAGLMSQKTPDPALLSHISFLAYEIMGGKIAKEDQFNLLVELGFITPWNRSPVLAQINDELVNKLIQIANINFGYPTDGLVLSATTYKAEDRYRPLAQKAFKINQLVSASEITGVEWGAPSKDGRMTPVAIIDPVEIGGSTISRVTLNNLDWIKSMNVGIGSVVEILKSGDVIPKITRVITNDDAQLIEPISVCPYCGTHTIIDGCDLRCPNEACPSRGYESVLTFITNLGIKRVSRKSLEAWGISDFTKLLQFQCSSAYKMQEYFVSELENKVFRTSEEDLFKALPFKDLADITLTKIINHYGYYNLKNGSYDLSTYPEGVGQRTMDSFFASAPKNFKIVEQIMLDSRYHPPAMQSLNAPAPCIPLKGSICFTGALTTMTRNEASKKAKMAGYDVKSSVVKGLTYLVTNDKTSGSSKLKAAAKYGTEIIDEQEFLNLL